MLIGCLRTYVLLHKIMAAGIIGNEKQFNHGGKGHEKRAIVHNMALVNLPRYHN